MVQLSRVYESTMGNGLDWRPVQANFNDANSAMSNSTSNISQAGTIFGQMRKNILEEEQKAIDNEYKERTLAESARQFNLTDRLRSGKSPFIENNEKPYNLSDHKGLEGVRSQQ